MDDLSRRLTGLGRAVAEVSDRAADPTTLQNARRRWLSASPPAPQPHASWRRAAWGAASVAFAATVVAIVLLVLRGDPALSFTVGAARDPGAVGQWVAPDGDSPLDLSFSEGTVVTLAPGARTRVTEATQRGASLVIERGAIHAAVKHREEDTQWSFSAGPYKVRVTGTTLDAHWDPTTETFELTMLEGSVLVSGPRLPSGRAVVAGERLVATPTGMELRAGAVARVEASASPSSSSPPPTASEASTAAPSAAPSSASSAIVAAADPSATADDGGWRALMRAGKYKDAMEAAERAGFSAEAGRASAKDLMALADTARFAGRPERAKEALLAMRRRFGSRGTTAFLLGKISADQLRSPGDAITWFEIYLQEEPGGALAEQALGRILEMKKRDAGAARLVAERYLARYPNGAYAALARSLTGKASGAGQR